MPDRTLALEIAESGSGAGAAFTFHLRLDNDVIASNQDLTVEQSRSVRELSRQYGQLFEQRRMPQMTREALSGIGAGLFQLWFEPHWARIAPKLKPSDPRMLVITSALPSVPNLPWELLRPASGDAIGADGKWGLRRQPMTESGMGPADDHLPPGPLRVLYMISAPLDQVELDFEREEELLLRAFGKAGRTVVFDSGDLGSYEELEERINSFRPHVVHLTGHGAAREDAAYFAFEGESGETDDRSTTELGQLFAGSGVQCAFISACQAGRAPERAALGGLAQGLLAEGVPLVIGWTASILDDVATQVSGAFYEAMASGQTTVDRALVTARQAVRKVCEERGDPSWTLAVLYAGTKQALLFDRQRTEASHRPSLVMRALPGMIEGYTPHFIGRRRELQRLLPGLRAGDLQVVLLTGLGGAGKSTLATRLARKLEVEGWTLLALSSSAETPLSALHLLQSCGDAFLAAGQQDLHALLNNAALPVADRLRQLVIGLNRGRFVLVLDNFESNLERDSRKILDPELARFYVHLLGHLVDNSRVIITSRYVPADVAQLPGTAREQQLAEFGEAAFLKFLLRSEPVAKRYRLVPSNADHLPHDLLVRLHRLLGATPRFLGQIRTVLERMPAAELSQELDRVDLSGDAEEEGTPGRLQAARDEYCEAIFTDRLYGRLSPEMQGMLSRAAVFGLPVTLEALAAVAGVPENEVRKAAEQWRSAALVHRDGAGGGELWSVYGMLRGWLMAPARLEPAARRAAHKAAGDFLVTLNTHDRESKLGVGWVSCLLEARSQYLAAGALEPARDVTWRISGSYIRQGLYAELEALHTELLERQEHPEAHQWIGRTHLNRGNYSAARRHYERALAMAVDDKPKSASDALRGSTIDLREGSYGPASEKFTRVLSMHRQISDRAGEASIWHQLASIDLYEGSYGPAREKFERALSMRQQVEDRAGEAATWHQLATIDGYEGSYGPAREKFERALSMLRQLSDKASEAATWHNLASLDLNEGSYGPAREKFGRALSMRQQVEDRAGEAATWHQLATIDAKEGSYGPAREKFERALSMHKQIGDQAGEAATWHNLASIDLYEGSYGPAREKLERALSISQKIRDRGGEALTWHQLASIDMHEDSYGPAQEKLERALSMCQQIGDRAGEAVTFFLLGQLAAQQGYTLGGLRLVTLSFLIHRSIGHGETGNDWKEAANLVAQLDMISEQFGELMSQVETAYSTDRGATLLDQAFG